MSRRKGDKKTGGRVKGTLNKETRLRRISEAKALSYLKNNILRDWQPLYDAQKALALGVKVQKTIGDKEVVYKEAPDARAGQYLIDVVVGKPVETKNVNSTVSIPNITYVKVKGDKGNGKCKK